MMPGNVRSHFGSSCFATRTLERLKAVPDSEKQAPVFFNPTAMEDDAYRAVYEDLDPLPMTACAYHRKFNKMREFGRQFGLIDGTLENHPTLCMGEDRNPHGEAMSKLELIKLWYGKTLMPMRHMYAWAVPCPPALDLIASMVKDKRLKGLVEIGAGTGYWAALLIDRGVDVVAFDTDINGSLDPAVKTSDFICDPVAFCDIYRSGPKILEGGSYASRALFLCYPPVGDSMCNDALKSFSGDFVIYVGGLDQLHPLEPSLPECQRVPRPCGVGTGHPQFFRALARDWKVLHRIPLPSHFFCRDHLVVLQRRSCASGGRNGKVTNKASSGEVEPHTRLTPKWPAWAPERACEHLFEIEKKNWGRFEKEFEKYVSVHKILLDLDAGGKYVSPLLRAADEKVFLPQRDSAAGTADEILWAKKTGEDILIQDEVVDSTENWKVALEKLMMKFPNLTTSSYFAKLSQHYVDLNQKTVKNARAKLLKLTKFAGATGDAPQDLA